MVCLDERDTCTCIYNYIYIMSRSVASSLGRFAIARRSMQTGGRHVPNPGQGGAPPQTTVSPHTTDPSHTSSSSTYLQSANPTPTPSSMSPAPRYTSKSKLIPARPARSVSVTLPNGDPEPSSYPPSQEYFDTLSERKGLSHPLWQFFHLDPELQTGLTVSDTVPRNQGSLEALEGDEDNLRSGKLFQLFELEVLVFRGHY
jgi:large subunit ribosomal protein L47